MKDETLDVIVPVSIDLDWPEREQVAASIRRQKRDYGIDRFMLACPGGGWRSVGFPPISFFEERAEFFRSIREELEKEGISCGWWITLTIKSGASDEWDRIVRMDGSEAPFSSCPADPRFRERFARSVGRFAEIAKPEFIFLEDDYSINASAWHDGCFCRHHLAEFARREGRTYTRTELKSIFESRTPEALALLRRWRALMRDTLVEFCEAIRREVDRHSPEIPIGSMQSGMADKDGDATEAIARALSGPRHRPFCRLYGTFYGGEDIERIPTELYHALYSRQHAGRELLCYHESDTFPHTRFFTSAACMRALMGSAYSMGFVGSTFQTQQLLDDPDEEPVYGRMFAKERNRFLAIRNAARQCELKGAGILFDPFWASAEPESVPFWTRCVSHFGIPYVTCPAEVSFLSGRQPVFLDDSQLTELLGRGLVLDADAAAMLCERGFGDLIGVTVGGPAITGADGYDLAGREIICTGFAVESPGRHMHRADFFAPRGNGTARLLEPQKGCEVVTELVSYRRRVITPGMTRFVNRLGGRVVVLGQSVKDNCSSSLCNFRRQKLLQELLVWCGAELVMVKNAARVFAIQNEAADPAAAGFFGMLTLTNLNADPAEQVELHLPEQWRKCGTFEVLDGDGGRRPLRYAATPDGIRLADPLEFTRSTVLFAR